MSSKVGPGLGAADSVEAHIKSSQFRPKSSQVGPSLGRAKSTWVQVNLSGLGFEFVDLGPTLWSWALVEQSQSGTKPIRFDRDPYQAESALGPCQAESAQGLS